MSTISVDNAKPSSGGTEFNLISGVAKVLGAISTDDVPALTVSVNSSSVTDGGTGRPQLNLLNAFSTANYYTFATNEEQNSSNTFSRTIGVDEDFSKTASFIPFVNQGANGTKVDEKVSVCAFGDLA